MMKKIRSIAMSAAVGMLILMQAAIAHAEPVEVCAYLDAHPSVAGIEDLAAMGIYGNGWTDQQVGTFIGQQIATYCPRHGFELQAFVDKWRSKRRVV